MSENPKSDKRSNFETYWLIFVALLLAIWLKNSNYFQSSIGSPLPRIDRVHERDLDNQSFISDYVKAGKPLIIVREKNDERLRDENVVPLLLQNCKDTEVPGIPVSVQNVLDTITPEQLGYVNILMRTFIGLDLKKWIDDRELVKFVDINKVARSEVSLKKPMPMLASILMPSFILRLLELFLRPLYMGDVVFTNNYLETSCRISLPLTKQEIYGRSLVRYDYLQDQSFLFWGGIDSSFYPVHRDNNDNDVFVDVVSGCKEFVIIHPDERGKLTKLPLPGANIWGNDFFSSLNNVGLERAWKGVINVGETMYMPGDSLHEARNNCPTTVSMSRRPWRGSLFRKINFGATFLV